jgi:hypothetical protein
MERPKSVQAVFGTTITTGASGGSIRLNPLAQIYAYGSIVQAVAVPQIGNFFALWGGGGSGNVNPLVLSVTTPRPNISALFAPLMAGRFALTVIPNGKGNVAVEPRANLFTNGQFVRIAATADVGNEFIQWSGDAVGRQNPLAIMMSNSSIINANFTGGLYPIRLSPETYQPTLGFRLLLSGEPGRLFNIEVSSNLHDWTVLRSLTNSDGTSEFTDRSATNASHRFYRAVLLP